MTKKEFENAAFERLQEIAVMYKEFYGEDAEYLTMHFFLDDGIGYFGMNNAEDNDKKISFHKDGVAL